MGSKLKSLSAGSLASTVSADESAGNLQLIATNGVLPAGVSDVVLTVSEIDLRPAGGAYAAVTSESLSVDLAQLTGGVSSLAQVTVASGTYDAMRVVVSTLAVTYSNGDAMTLDFSNQTTDTDQPAGSFEASLTPAVSVTSSAVKHLLIDLGSLARTHGRGRGRAEASADFEAMGPPFRVYDLDVTGSIGGVISSAAGAISNARVVAVSGGRIVGSARTDSGGNYLILGLSAQTYDLIAWAPKFDENDASSVTVTAGASTSLDLMLTARAEPTSAPTDPSGSDNSTPPAQSPRD